ncbi:MAG TPA: 4,5-DOPA dioxygenase extradiol [Candidatus Dormibacteraeota bacterium]|nr:4,5-DOPA dioxygenase extradiol [Candidatus Dormibacteraeota bacterium]
MATRSGRLPALFVGHGSPTNALEDNAFTAGWRALGRTLPRAGAILSVSAHWYTRGSFLTANERPRTIHDFGGFPKELYEVSYPAPGAPELAARVSALLAPRSVPAVEDWGLDHGTWSVLVHTHPAADVPVVQLSIDATQPAGVHLEVGRRLAPLREEGVLILGSGGIVHNLARVEWRHGAATPPWSEEFDDWVRRRLEAGDDEALADFGRAGASAALAVPTPEHYLPLLYVLGTRQPEDQVSFPVGGFDLGSLSMTSVLLGATN